MNTPPFLLADIGGTSSRLVLSDGAQLRRGTLRRIANDDAPGLSAILQSYVQETGQQPGAVCLAAAGPVEGDRVRLTNRDWQISKPEIEAATGCGDITLINDLQAMGYALAVPEIAGGALDRPRLVLAIGTGINAAVAHPLEDGRVFVPPAEHGYLSLPWTTPEDAPLLDALSSEFGAPVLEAGLSGSGLARTHCLLTGQILNPEEITAARPGTEATLGFILRLLGAALGTLALVHLPYGGIYLAGSVGRGLFEHLDRPDFRRHFAARGAYSDLVGGFPLRRFDDDAAPLQGAALHLAQFR